MKVVLGYCCNLFSCAYKYRTNVMVDRKYHVYRRVLVIINTCWDLRIIFIFSYNIHLMCIHIFSIIIKFHITFIFYITFLFHLAVIMNYNKSKLLSTLYSTYMYISLISKYFCDEYINCIY